MIAVNSRVASRVASMLLAAEQQTVVMSDAVLPKRSAVASRDP